MLEDYVDGVSLADYPKAAERSSVLERSGALLRSIHEIRRPDLQISIDGRTFDSWSAYIEEETETYIRDIQTIGNGILSRRLVSRIQTFLKDGVDDLGDEELSIIHGDPTLLNFVVKEDSTVFMVDFELAQIGNPNFDLAIFRQFASEYGGDVWNSFISGYGVTATSDMIKTIEYYQVFRLLRLCRGKLWIHRNREGFFEDLHSLTEIVERK